MSRPSRVAWTLWVLSLLLILCGLGLTAYQYLRFPATRVYGYWLQSSAGFPVFATVSAMLLRRRRPDAICWVYLGTGLAGSVVMAAASYAHFAHYARPELPGGAAAAWLASLTQLSFVYGLILLMFLFPTGRLPSPRWRPVAWTAVASMLEDLLSTAVLPGPFESGVGGYANPFAVERLAPFAESVAPVGDVCGFVGTLGAVAAVVVRFRRSRGEERQQLKMFAYAAVVGMSVLVAVSLGWGTGVVPE
ncbi:MAG: hypothetical protein M4D85_02590, partial [Actinomycetota bacterium]|nr:hypothetical protein [Actinomycetota bacterium]